MGAWIVYKIPFFLKWPFVFQAAYLVAVADPSSVAGRPGLIDQAQFINSKDEILDACQNLLNPEASQQQVSFTAAATFRRDS